MDAQVLVVGGGPVGLLVAAELAGRGVDTVVVERREALSERPKATTLHARTAQSLARRGYRMGEWVRGGSGRVGAGFHFAGMPGLTISAPATEPGPVVKIEQPEVERLFAERADVTGVRVLRGLQVTRVEQDGDAVRVTARRADGSSVTLAAEYLVGADGARSLVREQAGIAADEWEATVSALTGRVRLEDPAALPVGWHRTPRGWIAVKGCPDGRVHLRTLSGRMTSGGRRTTPDLEELSQEVAWIVGHEVMMAEPEWLSRFSDFSRLARSYRAGRILLAGDAAHVHFPIGGQGLSTGILDAVNLGWKLAHTVQGTAGAGLLDSYDEERRPAARRVVDNTQAQLALMRAEPALSPLQELFGGLLASGQGSEHLGAIISAQDTVLTGRFGAGQDGAGAVGRFLDNAELVTADGATEVVELLQEGRFLLLVPEAGHPCLDAVAPWAEALRVVRVAVVAPVGALPGEALLVRPDGYVAWEPAAGPLRDALARYLGEALLPAGAEADAGAGVGRS